MNELVYVVIDSLGQYPLQMFRDNRAVLWVYITQNCPTQADRDYNMACEKMEKYQRLEEEAGFGLHFEVVAMSETERLDKYIRDNRKMYIQYSPTQKINFE